MEVRHGHAYGTRGTFAMQHRWLLEWHLMEFEGGKYFPDAVTAGLDSYPPEDAVGIPGPPDNYINSGGHTDERNIVNYTNAELQAAKGKTWPKVKVSSRQSFVMTWRYKAPHKMRGYNYWITKDGWDQTKRLRFDQLEPVPFCKQHYTPPLPVGAAPLETSVILPQKTGYHLLIVAWIISDTNKAFYQTFDLEFESGGELPAPGAPTNLRAVEVQKRSVTLGWDHPGGREPIAKYKIYRDGVKVGEVDASHQSHTDTGLQPSSRYSYFISAVSYNGHESLPSAAIEVQTLNDDGIDEPPSSPSSLHSMGVTESSVSLMWGASTGDNPIASYHVYRDGVKIEEVPGGQTTYVDTGLRPDTTYHYYIIAKDSKGLTSSPSNGLPIKTEAGAGDYPAWALGATYAKDARVSYNGKNYSCFQPHTAHVFDWNPEATDEILWKTV
ncbi:MAG TPA: lytic polysaccharide monooxygenase [Pseudosphingobacterium sp.]|nr:lytic polysaccharide monooxygenase [Pseudosphingobacterium sp.]